MAKIVNFMVNEDLLSDFDDSVRKLGLTRTELLVALMQFVVRTIKEGQDFLNSYLEVLKNYPEGTLEDAQFLASSYREAYKRVKE